MPTPAEKKRRRVLLFKHGYRDPAIRRESCDLTWTDDEALADFLNTERSAIVEFQNEPWFANNRVRRREHQQRRIAIWMTPIPFPDRVRP